MADKIKVVLRVQANGRGSVIRRSFKKKPSPRQIAKMYKAVADETFR